MQEFQQETAKGYKYSCIRAMLQLQSMVFRLTILVSSDTPQSLNRPPQNAQRTENRGQKSEIGALAVPF